MNDRKLVNLTSGSFIVLSVLLMFLIPAKPAHRLPPDLNMPIIALELAETPAELYNVIGDQKSDCRNRHVYGTYVDFLYILSYVLAFISLGYVMKKRKYLQRTHFYVLFAIMLLAALGDVVENIFLFDLLGRTEGENIADQLFWLGRSTYFKWSTLGLAAGIISGGLVRYGKRKIGIIFAGAFGAALIGLYLRPAIELQVIALSAAWPWVFVKTLPLKFPWFTENIES